MEKASHNQSCTFNFSRKTIRPWGTLKGGSVSMLPALKGPLVAHLPRTGM